MPICPCGSLLSYDLCCGRFLEQDQIPSSPQELMRSRYTAFTQGNVSYLEKTMSESLKKNFDSEQTELWAKRVKWISLEVLAAKPTSANATESTVEFIATFQENGSLKTIHEISTFQKIEGKWLYTKGSHLSKKISRNDLCPCKSGKKYKHCCGK